MRGKRKSEAPATGTRSSKRICNQAVLPEKKEAPRSQSRPLMDIPTEIQLRIMSDCTTKALSALSKTCTYFRELSLHMVWGMKPVHAIKKNFDTLDEFEDLRPAVRSIRFSQSFMRSRPTAMKLLARRFTTRLKKGYFPGLTDLVIDFHTAQTDSFAQIMNCLSENPPKNLRSLSIQTGDRYSRFESGAPKDRVTMDFPKKLAFIKLKIGPWDSNLRFDPFELLDANKDTVTEVELQLRTWLDEFSMTPCPLVKTLRYSKLGNSFRDDGVAQKIRIKFPNIERLEFTGEYGAGVRIGFSVEDFVLIHKAWNVLSRVKSVMVVYEHSSYQIKLRNRIDTRDGAIEKFTALAKAWTLHLQMPELQKIEVYSSLKTENHVFDIEIDRDNPEPEINVVNKIMFKGEAEAQKNLEKALEEAGRMIAGEIPIGLPSVPII